jgi:hypothetical protein
MTYQESGKPDEEPRSQDDEEDEDESEEGRDNGGFFQNLFNGKLFN